MPAKNISLEKSKPDKLFYFVANLIVFRESDARCLLLQRSSTEKVHADKWCVPGGKLEWSDLDITKPTRMNGEVFDFENALEDLLARETFEESGILIDKSSLQYINSVAYIRPDGIPTMMLKFVSKYVSGNVVLEKGSFVSAKWVNASELEGLDCIDGVPDEVKKAILLFSKK